MIKKVLASIVVFSILFMVVETAAANSYAYGSVYNEDKKSLVEGAIVTAFDVDNGAELGSVVTDSDGGYSIDLNQYSKGYVDLRAVKYEKSAEATIHVNSYKDLHLSNSDPTLPIQEFPTVAFPIATIIGIMFIISIRKKE